MYQNRKRMTNGIAIKSGRILSEPIMANTPDGDPCRVNGVFFRFFKGRRSNFAKLFSKQKT